MSLSYDKVELAVNRLLRDLHDSLPATLEMIDQNFADEDAVMADILGENYALTGTPKPRRYATGELPTIELLEVTDFPYISVWAIQTESWSDHGGWGEVDLKILVHGYVIARDHTYLAKATYRYATAIQNIIEENTLGGLVNPLPNSGEFNMGLSWKREATADGSKEMWFVQPFVYELNAEFIIT